VRTSEFVRRACAHIDANLDAQLTLRSLGREVGLSPAHLQRVFSKALGVSPRQYQEARRLERVRTTLRGGKPVTHALHDAGFGSSSRLYERAAKHFGMSPAAYGRGGDGAEIGYAVARCPLGRVLVAATPKGVCSVRLGAEERALVSAARDEFPSARLAPADRRLQTFLTQIVRHIEGRQPDLDLPLDVRATAFQRRVWQALQRIPYGETRSYGEVARAIGRPTAARAVAQACATNPVALAVPCHRVVRADGATGGYRWGAQRKRALLAAERSAS
jgi:AraC family transcriptional regulator of adaptative response/methylated-DNA-[protein]-cysteine methyltransferase